MPYRSVRTFLWDLADEGLDDVMGRLRELGADGMHLTLAYHGGRFVCPHNPKRLLVHAPDGAICFKPLLPSYERLAPRVHPEYGSGALVERVREAALDYDLQLAASVVLFNNVTLSRAHSDCTVVNALGDQLEGALCPANPAVRTYAAALIEDLAHRVAIDVIELHDFAFAGYESFIGPVWQRVEITPALAYLMSLCFCRHCRRQGEEANIDVDELARRVEMMIRSRLDGDLSDRRINDEIADPYHPISRYGLTRVETVHSLLDDLIDAASPAVVQPVLAEEPDENWRWGIELHTLRERLVRLTVAAPPAPRAVRAFVTRYEELLQKGDDMAVDIGLSERGLADFDSFAATIEACHEAGVHHFIFSHYGLARLEMLDWIGAIARS